MLTTSVDCIADEVRRIQALERTNTAEFMYPEIGDVRYANVDGEHRFAT